MVFHYLRSKLSDALSKTRQKLKSLFGLGLNAKNVEEVEDALISADFGYLLSSKIAAALKKKASPETLLEDLENELLAQLNTRPRMLIETATAPFICILVGINGSGKTTNCAKLAQHFQKQGKKVLIGACDTFRAAAQEQLQLWANRVGCEIVSGKMGADAAGVAFDAIRAAQARGSDIVLIDTAGRLQVKDDLMRELAKLRRSVEKALPTAPHETLLVVDANLGQNVIDQARSFHSHTPLSGLILSKVDGTAKGGAAFAIEQELGIPIKFLSFGETIEDLAPFDPADYVKGLFVEKK